MSFKFKQYLKLFILHPLLSNFFQSLPLTNLPQDWSCIVLCYDSVMVSKTELELRQKKLSQLDQNRRWRNQSALLLIITSVLVVGCYFLNWGLLMILLLFPWYWILKQFRHYQDEARLDWQFLHWQSHFKNVDSVFNIPYPLSLKPLELPSYKPAKKTPRKRKHGWIVKS